MAYYNNEANWASPAPGRQTSWEQPQQPPSRSGTGHSGYNGGGPPSTLDLGPSSSANREEANAFASQFDGTWLVAGGDYLYGGGGVAHTGAFCKSWHVEIQEPR
jgi:hypothetical protein